MKKVMALLAFTLLSTNALVWAQNNPSKSRWASRKERRDAERAKLRNEERRLDQEAYQQAVAALRNRQFVVEADQVIFRNGLSAFVTPNTNFVYLNGNRSTVQTAFNTAYPGPNGIGGVTVDGTASGFQLTQDAKGNISCSFNVQGIGISAQIFIRLSAGSNNATVNISPNFNAQTLTLNGNILPFDQSDIFKGRSW